MSTAEKYSIKDLEKISGIKAHTIRTWEKRYNVIRPRRTDTNIRFYSNEDLRHILNISLLNKGGFKISSIAGMSASERLSYLSTLALAGNGTDSIEENLLLSLIELDEARFNHAFMLSITKLGFEKTFTGVIFPFFERVGIMWQAGTINPAQEHFFSNLIRQKLIAATDTLEQPANADTEVVLLLLPENELHEIGLLFYNYAFKVRGYRTIYLGQSVPIDSLDTVISACKPNLIITGMTSAINRLSFNDYIAELTRVAPDKKIFCTGPVSEKNTDGLPHLISGIKELRQLLGI